MDPRQAYLWRDDCGCLSDPAFRFHVLRLVRDEELRGFIRPFSVSHTAWEALDYIPIVLLIAIIVTLYEIGLRVFLKLGAPTYAVVAILGVISAVLILYRTVFPPNFGSEGTLWGTITYEGTVQLPIFLALAAACGIAYGGYRTMQEEGHRDQGKLRTRGRARRPGKSNGEHGDRPSTDL